MINKYSDVYKIIGQTIKKYRKEKNLTQVELSDKSNISASYLTKIEALNYDKPFSFAIMVDISKALEISIHKLLEDIE